MIELLLAGACLCLLPNARRNLRDERRSHRERFIHDAEEFLGDAERNGRGAEAERYVRAKYAATFRGE